MTAKDWYFDNLEYVKQYSKDYYQIHKEELVRHSKEYILAHKEEREVYNKNYRIRNKDEINRRQRERRKASPVVKNEYLIKHPEKRREYERNRRGRKKSSIFGGEYSKITDSSWNSLLRFYGGICLCCGTSDNLSADHVIPLCKGGGHILSNIQPLCLKCNLIKNKKSTDYRNGIIYTGEDVFYG